MVERYNPLIEMDDHNAEDGEPRWTTMRLSEFLIEMDGADGASNDGASVIVALQIAGFYVEAGFSCPDMFLRLARESF